MAGYVSEAVIKRRPAYYRHLKELEKAGIVRISSQELGERMNLTASQIRQDINCFGGFGQQGYGYNVDSLREEISEILVAQFTAADFTVDGLTGEGMTWDATGAVSKSPMAVVIENGVYVGVE